MGLDQYAYVAAKAGQYQEFWDGSDFDEKTREFVNKTVTKPREIAYWRKHPNLQGFMEKLWVEKGYPGGSENSTFNGIELELTWEDLERLKYVVENGELPETTGFFFGQNSDNEYLEDDLKFIREAKADLFLGLKVFYNSSW